MIKKVFHIIWLIAGITYVTPANCQNKKDYTWLTGFGNRNDGKKIFFDFSEDTLEITSKFSKLSFSEMNSCISDENGNLLLYFNGCDIANGNHELLENGSGFNEGIIGNWECPKNYGYPGAYQSALILPQPGNDSTFYIFHINDIYSNQTIKTPLLYSIVVIKGVSDRGRVILKNQQALQDSFVTSAGITAVKHAKNTDWWLIQARRYTNGYARLLITSEGLVEYPDLSIGEGNIPPGGQTSFSPDGTKFMRYTPKGLMVMDFDRQEGQLSNVRFLPFIPGGFWYGGTFSPNSRFIYLSDRDKIYQVDTWDEDLSLDTVEVWDGVKYNGWTVSFGMMQTGPDCRIYISSVSCLPLVHIIMNPDEKGVACNVVQRALELKSSNCGFPHFPNFRLGTLEPYCDPDKVVVTSTLLTKQPVNKIEIFPNPVTDILLVVLNEYFPQHGIIHIHDATGREVMTQRLYFGHNNIDMSSLPAGLYFYTAEDHVVKMKGGKIVKM